MQKLVEESRLIVISSSLSNVVGKNKKIKKEGGDDAQAVDPPSRQQGRRAIMVLWQGRYRRVTEMMASLDIGYMCKIIAVQCKCDCWLLLLE